LADWIQQIHSFRASAVMSCHVASAAGSFLNASSRSPGRSWTTPPGMLLSPVTGGEVTRWLMSAMGSGPYRSPTSTPNAHGRPRRHTVKATIATESASPAAAVSAVVQRPSAIVEPNMPMPRSERGPAQGKHIAGAVGQRNLSVRFRLAPRRTVNRVNFARAFRPAPRGSRARPVLRSTRCEDRPQPSRPLQGGEGERYPRHKGTLTWPA